MLTLDQAVAMALDNNRGLRSSALDVQKAQDKLDANRTRQFPSVSIYVLAAQQLRSFDFTLEKGVFGNLRRNRAAPARRRPPEESAANRPACSRARDAAAVFADPDPQRTWTR